jgi:hypothetical protein
MALFVRKRQSVQPAIVEILQVVFHVDDEAGLTRARLRPLDVDVRRMIVASTIWLRASVHRHPYLQELCTAGEADARFERFCQRVEEFDGIPLRVLENTSSAGDVILMHPLLLHAPPTTHLGSLPRLLLNKDIQL